MGRQDLIQFLMPYTKRDIPTLTRFMSLTEEELRRVAFSLLRKWKFVVLDAIDAAESEGEQSPQSSGHVAIPLHAALADNESLPTDQESLDMALHLKSPLVCSQLSEC